MSSVFGGKKATTHNQAYPFLQEQLGGSVGQVGQAGSQIGNMLGLNGGQAQTQGFDNFRNSTGYQFGMDQGMKAITGGAASKGLLGSGSTLKALQGFGQNFASSKYGDYLSQLFNLGNMGQQSANIISGAGQYQKSKETADKSGFIGSLFGK
jgi:hypothetical protein